MSTRASIQFRDEKGRVFHVYRGHDGHPANVLTDLNILIREAKDRWSGSEIELLVTMLLAMTWDVKQDRLPDYTVTDGPHGDEAYLFEVVFELDPSNQRFGSRGKWVPRVI